MQIVPLCTFLVIILCCVFCNGEDDNLENKVSKMDAKLTQLLQYHQGSVPQLLEQVDEKLQEITLLKHEILHSENTLKLVAETKDDLQRQINENSATTSQEIANILRVTTDIYNKIGPSCGIFEKEISKVKTDLNTAITTIEQLKTELNTAITANKQLTQQIVTISKEAELQASARSDLIFKHANLMSELDNSNKEIQCLQFKWRGIKNESSTCLQTKQEAVTIVEKFRRDHNLAQNDTDTMDRACFNNWLRVVEAMLDLGYDINQPIGKQKGTCLHWAANKNDSELATLLIKRGCDINPSSESNWTPLMTASWKGSLKVVKVLLEHGVILTSRALDNNNRTALGLAKYYKHNEIIKLIELKGGQE